MKYLTGPFLLCTFSALADGTVPTVSVAVTDGFPIYYYDDNSQTFKGPMIDSFRMICREAKFNCEFKRLPKKRLEQDFISGKIDVGSVINSETQAKLLKGTAYFSTFTMPSSAGIYSTLPKDQIPNSLAGYYGQSIISVRGWSLSILPGIWEAEKAGKLTIYTPTGIESAVRMLLQDRAKFLYANKEKMDVYFNQITNRPKVYYKAFKIIDQTFALSRESKQFDVIKPRLDVAIRALIDNKRLDPKTGLIVAE
ncbi:transporter substrate-binding domain-containing protein [Vibrio profundum]|uniref:substrate-binding periplasmic protein n=1 Tax=Vibrio profundum TaxID=2910247 RepID=UPI003D0F12F3